MRPRTRKRAAILASAAVMLAGCAKGPDSIPVQYVSDAQYRSFSCDDVEEELARVSSRVSQISAKQQDSANADAMAVGVGLVLFWPALFVLAATDDQSGELGRLKGEYEALDRVNRTKKCGLEPAPIKPAAPEAAPAAPDPT